MGDLYLGLDLSTQSLKSVLIDEQLNLVHSDAVVLDELGWEFLFRSILVINRVHLKPAWCDFIHMNDASVNYTKATDGQQVIG